MRVDLHFPFARQYLLNIGYYYCSGCPNHHPLSSWRTKVFILPATGSVNSGYL